MVSERKLCGMRKRKELRLTRATFVVAVAVFFNYTPELIAANRLDNSCVVAEPRLMIIAFCSYVEP